MAQSKGRAQRYSSWMVLYTQSNWDSGVPQKSKLQDQQLLCQEFVVPLEQVITNNHANLNQWAKDVKPHFLLFSVPTKQKFSILWIIKQNNIIKLWKWKYIVDIKSKVTLIRVWKIINILLGQFWSTNASNLGNLWVKFHNICCCSHNQTAEL